MMRKAAAMATVLVAAQPAVSSANPSMSADFRSMMQWLSNETAQGLAFNTGSMFDPPNELRPWRVQPDVSLGVGWVPLDKTKFPSIATPALAQLNPQSALPDKVTFPNLAFHLRMGLPGRWDLSVRGADMTTPPGYRLSASTTGKGQSNSLGGSLRRHFFGGDDPLLSVSANVNHVFGRFAFANTYRNMELAPGFEVDSNNQGELRWNVTSVGLNAIVSRAFGAWTPFGGLGCNRMSGSVSARMEADFASALILPSVGEASTKPEQYQTRAIFGFQKEGWLFSTFVNGEIKLSGEARYKTYTVSAGLVAPFRLGAGSVKKSGETPASELAYDDGGPDEDLASGLRDGPSSEFARDEDLRDAPAGKAARPARRGRREAEDPPKLIFLQ